MMGGGKWDEAGMGLRMGLCLIVLQIHFSREICDFPMFLQQQRERSNETLSTERVWEHGVRKQMTESEREMTFRRHVWRTVSSSSGDTVSLRECVESWEEGQRYLVSSTKDVAADTPGDSDALPEQPEVVYSCFQFVLRSPWIVQIRQSSPVTTTNATVCRGVPLLQDVWLLVDREMTGASPNDVTLQVCSLRGGFVIKPMVQQQQFPLLSAAADRLQDPLCAGYRGEMRLESGCLDGEGTTFYFRHKHCIPDDLFMFSTQPTLCLGSWTDGPYAFSVLKHDRLPHAWVLRHPYVLDNSFTVYLFKDLISPTSTPPPDNAAGGSLSVVGFLAVRDSPRPVSSLCTDEHEACSTWPKPCLSNLVTTLTCPRTCGICNASRPVVCSFPAELQGLWYDPETNIPAVLLNGTTLTIYSRLQQTETHHCIDWEPSTSSAGGGVPGGGRKGRPRIAPWEAMTVNGFLNGCRPRYSCVRFLRRSPFAVYLKLSETQTWPLVSSPEEVIDCRGFSYDRSDSTVSQDQNEFRDKHFRLVYSMKQLGRRTQCHLPEGLVDLDVTFSNGIRCLASLLESGTEFLLSLSSDVVDTTTSLQALEGPLPRRSVHQCLDSTDALPYSDLFLVTRTPEEPLRLWCWVFPRNRSGIFYQLRADQCNRAAGRRFRKDQLTPHATYTTIVNSTTKQSQEPDTPYAEEWTVPTTGNSFDQQNGPSSSKVLTVFEGRKTIRESHEMKKRPSEEEKSDTTTNEKKFPISCLAVLLLVLICAIIQLPCT